MAPYGLGLELGMTSIAAAVATGSSVKVVPASADSATPQIPAVVYAAHGRFATGADAARRAIGSPDRLAAGVLGNVAARTPVIIDSANYPADAVLGTMVHNVLAYVADSQGEPPQRVTVTHPTHWTQDEVAALADAVRPATPGVALQLIPNLIAAAMDHASTHTMNDGDAVAVVDIGATAFEAAVVGRRGNQVVLLGPHIERGAIGGDHFDTAVLEFVDQVTAGAVSALNTRTLQGQITLARLRRDCRAAKEALSTARTVDITAYLPTGSTPVRLSRTAFEDAVRPQVDVLIGAVVRTLRGSGDLQPHALLLTGGSTQVPLVQTLIAAIKGVPEVTTVRHAAARGAAALAAVAPTPTAPGPTATTPPATTPTTGGPTSSAELAGDPTGPNSDGPDRALDDGADGAPPPHGQAPPPAAPSAAAPAAPAADAGDGGPARELDPPSPGLQPESRSGGGPAPESAEPQQPVDVDEHDPQAQASVHELVAAGASVAAGHPEGERVARGAEAVSAPALPTSSGVPTPTATVDEAALGKVTVSQAVLPEADKRGDRPGAAWPAGGWPGGEWPGGGGSSEYSWNGAASRDTTAIADMPPGSVGASDLDDHWPQGPEPARLASPRGPRRGLVIAAAVAAGVVLVLLAVYLVIVRTWTPSSPTGTAGSAPITAAAAPPDVTTVVIAPPAPAAGSGPVASSDDVVAAALIPAGTTPGFAAVSPSGRQVYVANRAAGQRSGGLITIVDTATDAVSARISIPQGPAQYLAFSPDGALLYVSVFTESGRGANKVVVVDTATNTITASIDVGTRPYALATSPDGKQVWVPNHDSGTVSVIDAATNTLVVDIRVPANPHWIAFSSDGTKAFTANHESNLIAVLDVASRTVVTQIAVGVSPHSVAVHPTQPLVANVNYDGDSVSLIDTGTETVVGANPGCRSGCTTIKVGRHPQDLAWAPDGRHLYVTNVEDHTVSVINLDTRAVTGTVPVGTSPTSVAVTPDGAKAYVTNLEDGTVQVLKLAR